MTHQITHPDGYIVSDDRSSFDVARAYGWISKESYWAPGIPLSTFQKAVENSLAIGVYDAGGGMCAMARMVTDRATFGWLCDVFVDEAHRGAGLGKHIVAYVKGHPDLQGFRRMHLATRDAHGLYAQFGFGPLTTPENWMEIRSSGYL